MTINPNSLKCNNSGNQVIAYSDAFSRKADVTISFKKNASAHTCCYFRAGVITDKNKDGAYDSAGTFFSLSTSCDCKRLSF